jgi:NAD(P)-dependent dehydrogenase (short-subunit alcohol dehydrogenase family)
VTGFDRRNIDASKLGLPADQASRFFATRGDLTSEASVAEAFQSAIDKFGPLNCCIGNAGVTDESAHPNIWELETSTWDKVREIARRPSCELLLT